MDYSNLILPPRMCDPGEVKLKACKVILSYILPLIGTVAIVLISFSKIAILTQSPQILWHSLPAF